MKTIRSLFGALAVMTLAPMAHAQATCSGGSAVATARLSLPVAMRDVAQVVQYAWDEGNGLTAVCDLTGGTSNLGYWTLFSGEVDSRHPGICIGITLRDGSSRYSCATARQVRIAYGAPTSSRASEIRFRTWHASARPQ